MLQRFVGELESRCPRADFCPEAPATPGRPAIREVYPNALQVRLFDLDRPPVRKKHVYKRQKFGSKRERVARGLGPFVVEVRGGGRVASLRRAGPDLEDARARAAEAAETGPALKALEDRWDALLWPRRRARAFQRGTMHAYTGPEPGSWRRYILAPVLRPVDRSTHELRRAARPWIRQVARRTGEIEWFTMLTSS